MARNFESRVISYSKVKLLIHMTRVSKNLTRVTSTLLGGTEWACGEVTLPRGPEIHKFRIRILSVFHNFIRKIVIHASEKDISNEHHAISASQFDNPHHFSIISNNVFVYILSVVI